MKEDKKIANEIIRKAILNELQWLSEYYPEQRMGQIIFNYICSQCTNNDPFFLEDSVLFEKLTRATMIAKNKEKLQEINEILEDNLDAIDEIYDFMQNYK